MFIFNPSPKLKPDGIGPAGLCCAIMLIFSVLPFSSAAAGICGDANGDSAPDVGDVVYVLSFVFSGGPPPQFLCDGDVNGDGDVNVGDAVYLVNWIFRGGSPPACVAGGQLTNAVGCKLFDGKSTSDEACLEYQYDGQGGLTLTHINAGFNCCPGEIVTEIEVIGNTIIINEIETEPLCYCLCLFDLEMEIHFLDPGEYTIQVNELYLGVGDEPLVLTVDLTGPASGSLCLPRGDYPWDQSSSPSGELISNSDCLFFLSGGGRLDPQQSDDCLQFSYDGSNVLSVQHLNGAFNCCPQELLGEFTFVDNMIIITEDEILDEPCNCLCLFNVYYQITGVPPGVYILRINGMNLWGENYPLEATIDCTTGNTGSHCITREIYPWGEM